MTESSACACRGWPSLRPRGCGSREPPFAPSWAPGMLSAGPSPSQATVSPPQTGAGGLPRPSLSGLGACPLGARPARPQRLVSRGCLGSSGPPAGAERPGPPALDTACLAEAAHLPCERGAWSVSRPSSADLPADSSPAFLPSPPEQSPSKWYWKLVPVSGPCAQTAFRRHHLLPFQVARDCVSVCVSSLVVCCTSCGAGLARCWAGWTGTGPLRSREAFCSHHPERGVPAFLGKLDRQLRVSPLKR